MYVHAGNNRLIRTKDIVGIFDMDNATIASATRDYLRNAEKNGRMINIKEEIPKSFVVAASGKNKDKVYVSQISTSALAGRINSGLKDS